MRAVRAVMGPTRKIWAKKAQLLVSQQRIGSNFHVEFFVKRLIKFYYCTRAYPLMCLNMAHIKSAIEIVISIFNLLGNKTLIRVNC